MLLAPIAMYSLLLIVAALSVGKWYIALTIPLFFLLLISCQATLVVRKLSSTVQGYKGSFKIRPFGSSRFYYHYFISFFLNRTKLIFASTKILSVLILVGVINLYVREQYPVTIIYLGILVSMMFHFVLVFELRKFEDQYLIILRNLPIRSTVYIVYLITYFLVTLPELVVLSLFSLKLHSGAVMIPMFGVSCLLSLHVMGYFSSMRMRLFLRNSLTFFFAVFFALLLNTAPIVVVVAGFALSYSLFHIRYLSYEAVTR
jgi:hypothetical protein